MGTISKSRDAGVLHFSVHAAKLAAETYREDPQNPDITLKLMSVIGRKPRAGQEQEAAECLIEIMREAPPESELLCRAGSLVMDHAHAIAGKSYDRPDIATRLAGNVRNLTEASCYSSEAFTHLHFDAVAKFDVWAKRAKEYRKPSRPVRNNPAPVPYIGPKPR